MFHFLTEKQESNKEIEALHKTEWKTAKNRLILSGRKRLQVGDEAQFGKVPFV